ncbi:putative aminotransferase class I and II family protein [Cadophora sp. DSE1049]|nr:putative aminotransferase class I and II family protein [Cadophora sp. DSE1049]
MSDAIPEAAKYHLSQRGAENFTAGNHWAPIERALANVWDKEKNSDGIINLGLAENSLMHDEIANFLEKNLQVNPQKHLTYGTGPLGSLRLRTALSSFFTTYFHSRSPISPSQILPYSSISALTDALAWSICNEGEGILIPRPLYTGFRVDIPQRSRAVIVPVSFAGIDGVGTGGLDDVFDAEVNERAFGRAWMKCEEDGVKVRAVLLTNPHNPLGKCYSASTLKAIANFCGKHGLHLICDEIYALSVFENRQNPSAETFTSILTVDLEGLIDEEMVHVMYGPSKDFCANGLRLGALCSRNEGLIGAVASLAVFSWSPYVLQDLWAALLEDKDYLSWFISTNEHRLSENHSVATSFISSHNMKYFKGSNAGVFIWIDLRECFIGNGEMTVDEKRELERKFVKRCEEKGLFVGYGSNFFSEEVGWFRITFTVGKEILIEGLERLVSVLGEVGWEKGAEGR